MKQTIEMTTNEINGIVSVLDELARKLDIKIENHVGDFGGLTGFAEACVDMNSVDELISGLSDEVDEIDCEQWNLTESQWTTAIEEALSQKLYDLKSCFVEDSD